MNVSYSFGQEVISGSIPTQRISIKDHFLQTNQKLTFSQNGNTGAISISTSPTGTPFNFQQQNQYMLSISLQALLDKNFSHFR